jgi:hypothetical protein
MKESGILFHAKHAYMPNTLGYCGPDEGERIQQGLEEGKAGEDLVNTLQEFEAAYPFLKLIARNTGRGVFDYAVPEAYWIGNRLLEKVPVSDFYGFSHHELKGKDRESVRAVFKGLDGEALPHHSFYVMSTYAASGAAGGPNLDNESAKKVAELIDNCRISWGKVKRVEAKELRVEFRPLVINEGRLALAPPRLKQVRYNPDVKPFGSVRPGDVVSLHWNYACDVLTSRQSRNITRYTAADLALVNRFLATKSRRK